MPNDTMRNGILIDALYHKSVTFEDRRAKIAQIRAALLSPQGQKMMEILDQIVTPSMVSIADLCAPDRSGAYIAHEAQRNFLAQLKMLARYDERSDPGNPDRQSGTRRTA